MPRRNDAVEAVDIPLVQRVHPYLSRKKADALIYYTLEVEMTNAVQFIQKKNREAGERKYRIYDLIIAAFCRTVALRPGLNRFVADYQLWQRNEISFNFVVRKDGQEENSNRNALVRFEDDMHFEEIAAIMRQAINLALRDEESESRKLIEYFLRMPRPLKRLTIALLRHLDRNGRLPRRIREYDGLHVTAFIANLGNLNIHNPPLHYMFDWGTTSLFVTMGKMHRAKILDDNDNEYIKDTVQFSFTLDKRIADSFYLTKAMQIFQEHIENPEQLEERPDLMLVK
jgi:hypothetical protein